MIVVRVELHSAVTGRVTELARMFIWNVGGSRERGEYDGATFIGRSKEQFKDGRVSRAGHIGDHPRLALHVWHLVTRMLQDMRYGEEE